MEETGLQLDVGGEAVSPWGIGVGLAAGLLIALAAALGIFFDGSRRTSRLEAAAWAAAAFLCPPLALAGYVVRAYYLPPPDADRVPLLPWVRSFNYLTVTAWMVVVPLVVMSAILGVLALVMGVEVLQDVVLLLAVQSLVLGSFVIAWTYAFRKLVDRQPMRSLGTPLNLGHTVVRQVAGAMVGAGALLSVVGILALTGHAELTWRPSVAGAVQVLLLLVPLYIAAFMEEIVMRGYVQRTVHASWGHVPAVVLSALPFALLHVGNPNLSILGVFNIFLIGVFFSLTVIRTGTLWFAAGCHVAWNLVLGPVLAIPVSGIQFEGLFTTTFDGPDWLTGGAFGLEGSVVATGVFGVMVVVTLALCALGNRYGEERGQI